MTQTTEPDSPQGGLAAPLPALDDIEGSKVPDGLPPVVDAHVHFFPDGLFALVWDWFQQFGWPVRYRMGSDQLAAFLLARGISRIVGLHYSHKPGIARELNRFMAELCQRNDRICGLATVYPGEPNAHLVLEEAFHRGLKGVKLHSHVQCFHMLSEAMDEIYQACVSHDSPLIMHVGREPKSPAYPCDPYELCRADLLEEVIRSYPQLNVCVPHLGADEFDTYATLIERYDNLWLDTTMMLADYFPETRPPDLRTMRWDRIMYGSDFPNLPYAWDRELKQLHRSKFPESLLERVLGQNAVEFYGIEEAATAT
ncbi:amidohydrolase family protein [Thermodesulfobacteriota bacterium]